MFKVIECEKDVCAIRAKSDWDNAFKNNQNNYRDALIDLDSTLSDLLTYEQFETYTETDFDNMNLGTFKKITKSRALIQMYAAVLHGRAEWRRSKFKVA